MLQFKNYIKLLRKQLFYPNWYLGIMVNDFYLPRKELLKFIHSHALEITGKVLDIGCGEKPYENLFLVDEYIGIDIENSGHKHTHSKVDIFYDGVNLPFADASIDSILCFEVLEHVFEPEKLLEEMYRVLKPGSKILLTTPFIWNEHEVPYDYGRYTFFGLNHLFIKKGFKVNNQKRILSGISLIVVLISLFVRDGQEKLKKLFPENKIGKIGKGMVYLLFRPVFIVFNIVGSITLLLPKNERFYFNNGILAEKI